MFLLPLLVQGAGPETRHPRPPTRRSAGAPGRAAGRGLARPSPPASPPAVQEVEQIAELPVGTGWGPGPGTSGSLGLLSGL